MKRPTSWIVAAVACSGGCASSPPLHYYVLSVVPAAQRVSVPPGLVPVRLDRLNLPNELDRLELVLRIDATRVQIKENDRWAAPLDDMVRRVLTADLAARLPADRVADPNEPAGGEPRQSLAVDIEQFDGDATCGVTLRAAWMLKPPAAVGLRGSGQVQIPPGNCAGAASLPAVMSQALAQLSDALAAAIGSGVSPGGQDAGH